MAGSAVIPQTGSLVALDLGENVDAVAILLNHLLDSAHLVFDAPESGLDFLLVLRISPHPSRVGSDTALGEVDESVVTGESLPVSKTPHSDLIGGSIIKNGTLAALSMSGSSLLVALNALLLRRLKLPLSG